MLYIYFHWETTLRIMGLFDSKDLMGYFELWKNNYFFSLTRIGKRENHWNVKHLLVLSLYDFLTQLWGEQSHFVLKSNEWRKCFILQGTFVLSPRCNEKYSYVAYFYSILKVYFEIQYYNTHVISSKHMIDGNEWDLIGIILTIL